MNPTRKAITLPGGGKCVVRRLTANDFAITEGEIPIFHEPAASRETKAGPSKRQIESGVRFLRVVLLCCVSPITLLDGSRVKITDKEMDQAGPNELTTGEMTDDDARAILDVVTELSGLGKEAADAARPFPAEQEAAGIAGRAGEEVPPTPDGSAGTSGC